MRIFLMITLACCLFIVPNRKAQARYQGTDCCEMLAEALQNASAIHPGMKRAEVERTFEISGGLSFGDQTAYVFRKCHLIRLIVGFDMNRNREVSAMDTVRTVSKLSVEYEPKD